MGSDWCDSEATRNCLREEDACIAASSLWDEHETRAWKPRLQLADEGDDESLAFARDLELERAIERRSRAEAAVEALGGVRGTTVEVLHRGAIVDDWVGESTWFVDVFCKVVTAWRNLGEVVQDVVDFRRGLEWGGCFSSPTRPLPLQRWGGGVFPDTYRHHGNAQERRTGRMRALRQGGH